MSEFPAMRKFLKFVASQMQQRELLLFSEKPEIFLDKTINLGKTINNTILGGDLLNWIHENRPQAHIEIGDIEALFGQRRSHRYDVIVANHSNDKGGLLANLINRCAIYSTFIFVFGAEKEKVEAIAPKTLEDLYAVVQTNEQFVCIEPKLFFVSKMVAYSYFNEVPYKRLFSCVISQEKLEKMVFCKKAADIAKNKMVVGLIKDNLDKLERTDGFVDKDLNFCVLGIPNKNIQWQQLSLDSQFDVGTIVDISHTSRMILDEEQVDKWGNSALLPKVLIPYLHELLKHSAKEILRILEIGNGEGIYSKEIYGGQYSLFSVTVGQYIPSQKGCCTFACYYLDRLDSSALRIKNTATALYAQLSSFILEDARNRFLAKSVQTAIGSIMSRNGSHNIGSHVLAALSHNVGTLPDDRVLYQYIQQRMDYIATVTTDFPTWTQPTMFVADMMKTFLSQRHLLDHIVESEGLRAFQFQNPNMPDEEWAAQKNCVKIHVRRKIGEEYKEFIDYTKRDAKVSLQDVTEECDISLAIPGGIIGEHAFYTILENIIRNAAKHSWAKIKQWQIRQNEIELQYNNLELFIDFEEKDDEVKFNVYAKLPMAQVVVEKSIADNKLCQNVIASEQLTEWKEKFDDMGVVKAKEENAFKKLPDYEQEQVKLHLTNLKDDPLKKWVDRYDKQGGLTSDEQKKFDSLAIHHKQQVMLARPFIDSQGALRRENWGLAEMKISAGYLAGESIEAIGGIGDKKGSNEIITPRIKSEKVKRKCIESGKKVTEIEVEELYLGYEFSIAKPKEILIVVAEKLNTNGKNAEWGNSTVRKELNKVGVFVKTVDEIKQEKRLNYRYVIHYNASELFDKDYHVKDGILLPFRVLSGVKIKNRLNKFIPAISFGDLKKCFESRGKTTIARKTDIERLVYKVYSAHLFRQQNIEKLGLLVAINENEKSGGNSLISDADILELMMEQNFAVCIDQYDALAQNENFRSTIKLLHSIKNSSNDDRKVVKFKYVQGRTIRELIAQRLYNWIYNNSDINDDEICRHLKQKYYAIEKKGSERAKRGNGNSNNDDFERGVNALLSKHPIDDFIRYAESVFENTKKLFKQYEEQIVTLPAGYKINTASEVEQENEGSDNEVTLEGVKIVTNIEDIKKEKDRHWIGYRRHAHTIDGCKRLYVEPLSGTQTYLSQLTKVKDNLGLQMRLIENGLMRILVLDERVAKFLREHQKEVGPHYKAMNINVIDDKWVEGGSKAKTTPDGFFTGYTPTVTKALKKYAQNVMSLSKTPKRNGTGNKGGKDCPILIKKKKIFKDIDILIVHQGILDKWFSDLKSVEGMKYLLEGFKRLVKYVVVTTGRGTPENIPEEAHLLPFAVVESTLFKKYPEKLILTDTIMNVLPVGKKNDNSGGQE